MWKWRSVTRKSLADTAEQSKTLDKIPASCLKINNPDSVGECTRERPHTAANFSLSAPPLTSQSSPSARFKLSLSTFFNIFFCFAVDVSLFSFIALFNKLGCRTPVIGYSEIAVKWFISWLTFTTCMNFCECTCICKRAGPGAGRGRRPANFLFLISELALNQGSKVGLAQQLWQDKHLFSLLLEARVILLPAICKPLKRPVHTCVNTDVNMGKHQFFSLRGKH